jgi:hypothetical protein
MKTKQYSLMITLKSLSALLYKISLERGDFNLQTSAKAMELWISSDWRKLSDANPRMPDHLDWTTEKELHKDEDREKYIHYFSAREEKAADVIIDTLILLEHCKCANVEQLLKDRIRQRIEKK